MTTEVSGVASPGVIALEMIDSNFFVGGDFTTVDVGPLMTLQNGMAVRGSHLELAWIMP